MLSPILSCTSYPHRFINLLLCTKGTHPKAHEIYRDMSPYREFSIFNFNM